MREIVFRGKTEKGEWIEGFYHYSNLINPTTKELVKTTHWILPICGQDAYDVIPESVSEFTGLTDKNGKKIFEGDVVQHFGTYNLEVYIEKGHTKVRWFDTVTNRKETTLFFGDESPYGEFEVVGNIHDNPELLKDGVSDA